MRLPVIDPPLEWRHIEDHVLRLPPAISKNKDGRVLILVGELAEIIERRRALKRDVIPWVFFREDGKQVKWFYRSWKTACLKAGLPVDTQQERKRFHDFRRTTARDLSRAGIPDRIAMSIMGHKTRSIYDRYNIVNEGDIAQALTQAAQYRARRGYIRKGASRTKNGRGTMRRYHLSKKLAEACGSRTHRRGS